MLPWTTSCLDKLYHRHVLPFNFNIDWALFVPLKILKEEPSFLVSFSGKSLVRARMDWRAGPATGSLGSNWDIEVQQIKYFSKSALASGAIGRLKKSSSFQNLQKLSIFV